MAHLIGLIPRTGVVSMIVHAGPVAKTVIVILVLFSVVGWAIYFEKIWTFRRADRRASQFLSLFRGRVSLSDFHASDYFERSALARIFLAGQTELDRLMANPRQDQPAYQSKTRARLPVELLPNIIAAMENATLLETEHLERRIPFLATTASVSPFLGLFGTVWGVMKAFLDIRTYGSANVSVVAPGIAEALITTVFGLAVAIPAVITYNHLVGRLRAFSLKASNFASEVAGRVRQEVFL
jgi:biopolymer transport protein TolQ